MAREVYVFDVTIPAGTAKATPQVSNLTIPARVVTEIEIIIPPGPNGLVGFALGAAGQSFLPYNPGGAFVTGNNEVIKWPLEDQITSGAWQLFGYNLGAYAHTLEIRFLCDLPPTVAPTTILAPADQLGSGPAAAPALAPSTTLATIALSGP